MPTNDNAVVQAIVAEPRKARREMAAITDALIEEFAGRVPPGTVHRAVARARYELLTAGVRHGLFEAVKTMAHTRLRILAETRPAHDSDGVRPCDA